MRIAQLTLHGFKSFGNRTTLEFSPGVTAIVGPNGSGKSNILDALKWTTGGGRATAYRAGEKRELIFHGAAGKRGVGYAEVEVEFVDGAKSIKIQRTLTADGTSKLRLNGSAARFLDVDEVLAGTGLGTSGLAVIGQGEVSQVLMADPERLLGYVAEAAGVARLSGRREQTEQRLQTARQHLERLEDVVRELEHRLETLADEAEQATRHQELSREALQLRYTAAVRRVEGLNDEIDGLGATAAQLEEAIVRRRDALAQARESLDAAREAREASEATYRQALADSEAKRGNLRVAEARVTSIRDQLASLRERHGATEEEVAGLADLRPPEEPEADVDALDREARAAAQRLDEAASALGDAKRRVAAAEAALAEHRQRVAAQETERAAALARQAELRRQLEALGDRRARSGPDAPPPANLEEAVDTAQAELSGLEARLDDARAQLERVQREHAEAAAEAMARSRAAERMRAAFASRRGYAQGPRNALTSGFDGIVGSVADLLGVPEDLQEAIAGALGRRAEYVVVRDAAVAERVLAHVRRAGGYVTLLPLDLVRGGRRDWPDLAEAQGVVGNAADLVDAEPRYRAVVDQLLGGTLVVETMDHAVAIARAHASRPRLVTRDGSIVDPSGAMSGGARSHGTDLIGAAGELEAAEQDAAETGRREAALRDALVEAQARVKGMLAARPELVDRVDRLRSELARAREAAAADRRAGEELARREEELRAMLAAVDVPEVEVDPEESARRERESAEARSRLDAAEDAAAAARQVHADAERRRALGEERVRSHRVALERYERDLERQQMLQRRLEELAVAVAESERRLARAAEERDAAEAALPKDLGEKEAAYRASGARLAEREREVTELTEKQAHASEQLEQVRVQLARRESALEIAIEERAGFPDGLEPLDVTERTAKARLREVEGELEAIGPVNHRAAQEHAREHERFEALTVEMSQAELAVSELAGTLERLDRETTTRLRAAIEGLTGRFAVHVRELFGPDARGDIDVDYDGARPIGLRIRLQPPGKKTESLNLLSVGERTMGALSFLFALMAEGGSEGLPVAVLDEVDAPLDEANIRRYCAFLQRLAGQGTQFVLITHQKATFEVADTLWGVTTDGGVSRVFSISRRDAVAR